MSDYDGDREHAAGAGTDVERGLADLAEAVRIGPAPFEQLLTVGRRRLRRRRMALTGATLVTAAVLGGGVLIGASHLPTGHTQTVAAASGAGVALTPGSSPGTATTPTPGIRDPFTPVRTLVSQGTVGGKQWQAWAALWPAASREQSLQQARLIWQDEITGSPSLSEPTADYVRQYWQPDTDVVDLYVTLDGHRLNHDTLDTAPPPSAPPHPTDSLSGGMVGYTSDKSGEAHNALSASPVVMSQVGPDVAKVVVTWKDGSTSEPALAAVGDSPSRWFAVLRPAGASAQSVKAYGKDGTVLATDTSMLR
ncbi:hypothetical protein [Kitasatospora mediocidica]|uniref:hypothetical protein n=1 Tax=Kitasatospora mediocidica TaxID=58352 RepID=UPI0005645B0E|nr:hypothetical protein [Kitasatospora mediocidica]